MSTNCDQVKPVLTEYALQESTRADAEAIEAHVAHCRSCRSELDDARAMLGILQRAEAPQELPRSMRIVAQPAAVSAGASWWSGLWNNAGRIAFAGGALACLAVGLLGIFQARFTYQAGEFQIAFGAPTPAATAVPDSLPAHVRSPMVGELSRTQMEALIAAAIQASEVRQKGTVSGLIRDASLQADERRAADVQQMAETFRYMQAAQTNMWKEQVQSQQIVAALAEKNGLDLSR